MTVASFLSSGLWSLVRASAETESFPKDFAIIARESPTFAMKIFFP